MTKPMIKIHNATTGEIVEREMNAEELAQLAIDKATGAAMKAEQEKAEADKASAETKLAALGLITDDLKALGLGTN